MRVGKVSCAECCVSGVEEHWEPFGLGIVVYAAERRALRCCLHITEPNLEGLNLLLVLLSELDGSLHVFGRGLPRTHGREHPAAPRAQRDHPVVWKGDSSLQGRAKKQPAHYPVPSHGI